MVNFIGNGGLPLNLIQWFEKTLDVTEGMSDEEWEQAIDQYISNDKASEQGFGVYQNYCLEIDLSNRNLSDDSCISLVRALAHCLPRHGNPPLRKLDLSANNIGPEGSAAIANALKEGSFSFTSETAPPYIYLEENPINKDSAITLMQGWVESSYPYLPFAINFPGLISIQEMEEALGIEDENLLFLINASPEELLSCYATELDVELSDISSILEFADPFHIRQTLINSWIDSNMLPDVNEGTDYSIAEFNDLPLDKIEQIVRLYST